MAETQGGETKNKKKIQKNLVTVGDGECGKTCLMVVFTQNHFPEDYTATDLGKYGANITVDGKQVELSIWDTAGQDEYDRLRPLCYVDTHVILMCFSIDNPDSLQNILEKWNPEMQHFCPGIPIILVGNKKDLRDDPVTLFKLERRKQIPVSSEEGKVVAERIGAAAYVECSAKTNEGVREVFETAIKVTFKTIRRQKSRRKYKKCSIL
ncbi:hypothetical protein C0Q70_14712 [Pomacea canaliculata]|uniref:Uncharacterized protein n=1 Tax=Pomacea canaliculata TaxID=400727 RepID=A0A2T7NSW3_POMCA|nr:ras-like GTP-binding protein rhoA [Pomacea canaliculata]PVD24242.1 hypothetical protein C0Q70_14712 [Pomacea canaliculata]